MTSFARFLALPIVFLFMTCTAHANGIMIEPLRVEMKDGQRYAVVTILNQSKVDPVKYSISIVPLRMKKDGTLYEPEKKTKRELLTKSMIRFSPRSATIPPAGSQSVRIVVRKPPNIPAGEYMTYMQVSPLQVPNLEARKTSVPSGASSIAINMLVGMRIPVIIHEGNPDVQSHVQAARFAKTVNGKPAIDLTIDRSGKKSSYVGISVYSVDSGEKTLIAHKPRLVTYFPLKSRNIVLPVTGAVRKGSKILVELNDYNDPDKKVIDSKMILLK